MFEMSPALPFSYPPWHFPSLLVFQKNLSEMFPAQRARYLLPFPYSLSLKSWDLNSLTPHLIFPLILPEALGIPIKERRALLFPWPWPTPTLPFPLPLHWQDPGGTPRIPLFSRGRPSQALFFFVKFGYEIKELVERSCSPHLPMFDPTMKSLSGQSV